RTAKVCAPAGIENVRGVVPRDTLSIRNSAPGGCVSTVSVAGTRAVARTGTNHARIPANARTALATTIDASTDVDPNPTRHSRRANGACPESAMTRYLST